MLSVEEVSFHLDGVVVWYRCLGDIPGNNKTRKKEQGAAIFARPVAGFELEFREEGQAVRCGFEGSLCWLELGESLYMLVSVIVERKVF
jgi:hypothetical protein